MAKKQIKKSIFKRVIAAALVLALAAGVLAMINVAGGFALTHKMLSSFVKKGAKKDDA